MGESCNVASDCASGACNAGVCTAGSGVSAALAISTDWGSGYCAVLTVTNTSAAPTIDVGHARVSWHDLMSLPRESDPDGDGAPAAPLPTVILLHGFPLDHRVTERPQYQVAQMLRRPHNKLQVD